MPQPGFMSTLSDLCALVEMFDEHNDEPNETI